MSAPQKIKDVPANVKLLTARLARIKSLVENMTLKRGKIYIDWLPDHAEYLKREKTFKPSALRTYRRREIVYVNFGFNVGAEIGGVHFAVVTTNSGATNPVVNVIPLGSLESDQGEQDLHKKEVYLGVIPGMNGLQSYAIPNQLQPISKLRIIRPTNKREQAIKLDPALMDKIDKVVVSLYVKGYVSTKEEQTKELKQHVKEVAATNE